MSYLAIGLPALSARTFSFPLSIRRAAKPKISDIRAARVGDQKPRCRVRIRK
jgi:hypothetical protein